MFYYLKIRKGVPTYSSPASHVVRYGDDGEKWMMDMSPYGVKDGMSFDEMVAYTADRLCDYVETYGKTAPEITGDVPDLASALESLDNDKGLSLG